MPISHAELATLLERRIEIIADHAWRDRDADAHLDALKEVSENIAQAGSELDPPAQPRLAHFLENCSYDKALAFIREQ